MWRTSSSVGSGDWSGADVDRDPASFRDPSGFVFFDQGVAYRAVAPSYADQFNHLHSSGLYDDLTAAGLLIPHEEAPLQAPPGIWKVLRPEQVEFISYPYEWCPEQLAAAGELTLEVQRRALRHGMSLKDASAFNVQFRGTRPVLIDTLSFEPYVEGRPWVAYHQFCTHFLGPLAVAAYRDPRLTALLARFLDGLPLDLVSRALPRRTWLRPGLLFHLHAHARATRRSFVAGGGGHPRHVYRAGLKALLDHLSRVIEGFRRDPKATEWRDYRETHGYQAEAMAAKVQAVLETVDQVRPAMAWDLGANTGSFSAIVARTGSYVVALDQDVGTVSRHFGELAQGGVGGILPLWVDLANPTPGLGWCSEERRSLTSRGPADLVLALALVHHLRVTHQVSFEQQAALLAKLGRMALVEWVGPDDPQAQRLTAHRHDRFDGFDRPAFEAGFASHFRQLRQMPLPGSERVLYLFERS